MNVENDKYISGPVNMIKEQSEQAKRFNEFSAILKYDTNNGEKKAKEEFELGTKYKMNIT